MRTRPGLIVAAAIILCCIAHSAGMRPPMGLRAFPGIEPSPSAAAARSPSAGRWPPMGPPRLLATRDKEDPGLLQRCTLQWHNATLDHFSFVSHASCVAGRGAGRCTHA